MSINIGDNFSYLGKKFLDNRQSFDTLELMNNCSDVPLGFITFCKEDNKRYEYSDNGWVEYKSSITDEEAEKLNIAYLHSQSEHFKIEDLEDFATKSELQEGLACKFDNVEVNEIETDDTQTALDFYSNGEVLKTVYFSGGGGGGSTIVPPYISTILPENSILKLGETFDIQLDFSSSVIGRGTLKIFINDVEIRSVSIPQGENVIPVEDIHFAKGENRLVMYVIDRTGVMSNSLTLYVRYGSLEIASDFDAYSSYDYGAVVRYYFTPTAVDTSLSLTMYMNIDGEVAPGVSCTSDTRGYFTFPNNLDVGVHRCQAYIIDSGGDTSNVLAFNLVVIDDTSLVVASDTVNPSVEEGSQLVLDYKVYMKNNISFVVKTYINEELVNTGTCGLATEYYRTSTLPEGNHTIKIEVFDVTETVSDYIIWTVTVTPSTYDMLEPVKTGAMFIGSALNMTNSSENREIWAGVDQDGNAVNGILNGFAFNSENGWVNDEILMTGASSIEIPVAPLANNARYGFTLDLEFASKAIGVEDALVLNLWDDAKNCGVKITTEKVILRSSEGNECELYFTDDEITSVVFVIDRNETTAKIYLNGVMCSAFYLSDYSVDGVVYLEDFSVNGNIILGGSGHARIRNLRVYQVALTTDEILNNFMANETDKKAQQALVTFQKGDDLPTLTVYCDFSGLGKDDKKPCSITYISTDEEKYGKSFTLSHKQSSIQYQGTSSMAYPIKNYRLNLADENGNKWRYDFPFGKPEHRYTLKADFMASGHWANTGLTKWINKNLYNYDINDEKTMNPKKWYDINNGGNLDDTRECIYGFPCRLILVNDGTTALNEGQNEPTPGNTKDMGIFNFNHDKDATDTMGFDQDMFPNCASYEVTANSDTSAGAFMSYETVNPSDMSELEYLKQSFEMRFPDEEDVPEGWGFMGIPGEEGTGLKALIDWVDGCSDEEFVRDFEEHFHKDYTLRYYLMVITLGMVDNLGKNMMLDTWDNKIFMPRFYDCDTICSYDNSGDIKFDVDIEMEQGYWNTSSSRLWTRIRDLFHDELVEKYNDMRQNGLSYESLMYYFYDEQIAKIPQKYYNMDYDVKYAPFADSYMGMAHGDGYEHLKRWLKNRLIFCDTLFDYAPSYTNDMLTIRANTTELMNIQIETYTPVYQHVSWYNGQMDKKKIDGKTATEFSGTAMAETDQEVLIYGGSNVKKISGITSMNPNQMLIGSATKLSELSAPNCPLLADINSNKANLSPHTYLNKVDLSNCPQLGGTLRLNNSQLVRDIDISGTIIDGLQLPPSLRNLETFKTSEHIVNMTLRDAPLLNELKIPVNIEYLSLINVPNLTAITSSVNSFDKLNTLIMENPTINPISNIISKAPNLQYVRLIGLNISCSTQQIQSLLNMKGVDSLGNEIPLSQSISGKITLTQCSEELERQLKEQFPLVEFTIISYVKSYAVTFVDGDGNTLYVTQVVENGEAIYIGNTPTKTSTAQYDYEWRGWDRQLKPITSDCTIVATFDSILRYYTIRFINSDTLEVFSSQYLAYGSMPTRPSLPEGFNAFEPSIIESVTGDLDYYARYLPYPEDLSIFSFSSMSYGGINGYSCTLKVDTAAAISAIPSYLIIPFEYQGEPVIMFSHSHGSTITNITEIYCPDSIKILGRFAFSYLTGGIKSIEAPGVITFTSSTSSVDNKSYYQFCQNTYLEEVKLPKLQQLLQGNTSSNTSFRNNKALKRVWFGSPEYPFYSWNEATTSTSYHSFYNTSTLEFISLVTKNGLESDVTFNTPISSSIASKIIYSKAPVEIYSDDNFGYKIAGGEATITAYTGTATEIVIPDTVKGANVTAIENDVFYNSSIRTTITSVSMPNTVTSLGANCFEECSGLITVTGLDNVTNIGSSCFQGCSSLNSTLDLSKVTSLGNNCFHSCSSLTSINIPNVTSLGQYCFYNCSNLNLTTDISNVTSIGQYCFYGCSSLSSVSDLPNITSLSFYCFHSCSSLTSINAPNVTVANAYCCYKCSNLTEVNMPNVTSLENYSFTNCSALTSINIPNATTLGEYCFSKCSNLTEIDLPSVTKLNPGCLDNIGFSELYLPKVQSLDSGVPSVKNCPNLKNARLGSKEFPFKSWAENSSYGENYYHFAYCDNLQYINLITTNGQRSDVSLPYGVPGRIDLIYYSTEPIDIYSDDNFVYRIMGDEVTVTTYNGTATEIEIPSTVKGANITKIGDNVFYNSSVASTITSVTIPDTVTSLGDSCFRNCSKITSIDILNVTSLGNNCFRNCSKLTSVDTLNVTSLGYDCFNGCVALTSIDLPNAITLGNYCFQYCYALTSANLPNATDLGNYCFSSCTALTSITLPKVTTILVDCFIPSSLSDVTLGGVSSPILNTDNFNTTIFPSGVTTLIIYVSDPSNPPTLTGSPWGAINATITYEQA